MPAKLQTTVAKISTIPNAKNSTLVKEYYEYMIQNGSSERHINNQVKAAIAYSISLGSKRTLCNVRNSKQILEFLDSKVKDQQIDPDKKWITTWNYLHRIKRLFRWLHKQQGKKRNIPEEELKPWADKVKQIRKDPEAKRLRVYFNNHYAGAAVEML
jgi:hypothetical protein